MVNVTCWELKSHLLKALMLFTSTYGTETWEGNLKKSHWEVFEKGMKMHVMAHINVCSLTTYHISLAKFVELPKELYALELIMGFQQELTHLR